MVLALLTTNEPFSGGRKHSLSFDSNSSSVRSWVEAFFDVNLEDLAIVFYSVPEERLRFFTKFSKYKSIALNLLEELQKD